MGSKEIGSPGKAFCNVCLTLAHCASLSGEVVLLGNIRAVLVYRSEREKERAKEIYIYIYIYIYRERERERQRERERESERDTQIETEKESVSRNKKSRCRVIGYVGSGDGGWR